MCGRFTQYFSWSELVERYRLTGHPLNIEPRYNIAPTTRILVLRADEKGRYASFMRWGLIPSSWQPGDKSLATFNARDDSVETKPAFMSAFKSRRCIVPMSGFYEWRKDGKLRTPFYFSSPDGSPLSVAGLWETREVDGSELLSCTVITTQANATVEPVHGRMPVILGAYDIDAWLSGRAGRDMLVPCAAARLTSVEVSPRVNTTGEGFVDDPECIAAVSRR